MAERPHIIQYRLVGKHHTTVLCWDHETALLQNLRSIGIGCSATTAPSLANCDACEDARIEATP